MPDADTPHAATPQQVGWRRLQRFFLWFMMAAALLYALSVNAHWRFQRDSVLYMGLARSLAETGAYRFNHQPHTLALPGFPAMLALVYLTLGESFLAMNVLVSLFGLGCIAMAYLLFRELPLSGRQVIACLLLFGLSRTLYYYSTHVMTDVPFTLLVLVALYCGLRMLRAEGRAGWLWCLGASAATSAATLVRPFGPALGMGLLAGLWLRAGALKSWKENVGKSLVVLAPLALIVAAWVAYCASVELPGTSNYGVMVTRHGVQGTVLQVLGRVPRFVEAVPDVLAGTGLRFMGAALLLILMAVGFARTLLRREALLPAYVAVYVGGVFLGGPGRRYLLPVLPVMVYWLVEGACVLGAWAAERRRAVLLPMGVFWLVMTVELFWVWPFGRSMAILLGSAAVCLGLGWWITRGGSVQMSRRRVRTLGYVLLAMLVATNLVRIGKIVQQSRSPRFYEVIEGGRLVGYAEAMDWLREHADPQDVVLTHEARLVHYFTGTKTLRIPWRQRGPRLEDRARFATEVGVRYILRDSRRDRRLVFIDELIGAYPAAFEAIGRFGELQLIRVHPGELGGERQ